MMAWKKVLSFTTTQTRNQLGTLGGMKRGPKFLNYVQHIFPGGRKIFQGDVVSLVTCLLLRISVHTGFSSLVKIKSK